MKLNILNIVISTRKKFIADMKRSIVSGKDSNDEFHTIVFDSLETFKRIMTINKLHILMAISRLKPESINQLAKSLNREYPHVLKDCNSLKDLGFIKLNEIGGARKQLMPTLIFEFDIIRVKTKLEEIHPISERSNNILLTAKVANS